jgi:predicted DCC family thiol-disulfide oxidoreductase YuxK
MSTTPSSRPVLIYDVDCGFCRWAVALILDWDRGRRLDLMTLQDPRAAGLLASVPAEERMRSSHLVMPDGTVHSGGASVEPLARLLPAGTPAALVARAAPGLMDAGYRLVAGNRMRVSKLVPAGAKRRADERIRGRVEELERLGRG